MPWRRRFALGMLSVYFPLAIALFYFVTAQVARLSTVYASTDRSEIALRENASFWGHAYRSQTGFFDGETLEEIGRAYDLTPNRNNLLSGIQHRSLHRYCDLIDGQNTDLYRYVTSGQVPLWQRLGTKETHRQISLSSYWLPYRMVVFFVAAGWWLLWTRLRRRADRSLQPLADMSLLIGTLLLCTGARWRAYVNGPDWNGYLHVWESVAFLGTALSIVGWVAFWIVFGPQRWPIRAGMFVVGAALIIAVIIAIWDIGSQGYDASLARAQTFIGALSLGGVLFGVFRLAKQSGLVLTHAEGVESDAERFRKPQAGIRDLMFWVVAFGLLFAISRLRSVALPGQDEILQLLGTGVVGGVVGCATIWIVLGIGASRFLAAAITYFVAYLYFSGINRMEVLHVGLSWIPVLLLSGLALRWNGYSIRHRNMLDCAVENQIQSPVTSDRFVW